MRVAPARTGVLGAKRGRRTASSYAARRLSLASFILGQLGSQSTNAFSPASRVSISELLGGIGAKGPGMKVLCKQHIDGRITETAIVGPGVTS